MLDIPKKKIQPDNRKAKRRHIRHERPARKNMYWRKTKEEPRPDRCRASKDLPDEQKEKWQRNREQNDRLNSPDPFVHTRKLVADRRDEGQNWKFRSDITGRVACPINLRIAEAKSVLQKIPRDRRHVALPPAPVIDVRLINENQSRSDRENADYEYNPRRCICSRRPAGDVRWPCYRSQSSAFHRKAATANALRCAHP